MRRIMYVENKRGGLDGDGRIGWVELSRSRRTYHYRGRHLAKTGSGYKYNCIDEETREAYWVSGPRRDGADKLYGGVVHIDEDARVEYWTRIRERPDLVELTEYRAGASTRTAGTTRRNDERVRGRARSRPRPSA
ncbi:1-deoxy-D-xylulose-5-phosphate synthase [Sorangium sp. So ce693]|uniref:1-deoxy-D-xylulose-5-phosphate synthase n=1 Tax=Sorangium sp. So ce693 TaxID=3133318 RepID=UPI003F5DAB41